MARDLIPGDVTIRSIKPGDPRKRLNDGDGLYLRLFVKGGSHGWRLDYTIGGVRKNLSLGTYPDTGLALARDKATEARKLVSAGVDPSDVRKAKKAATAREREVQVRADAGLPPEGSFEAVAREWSATLHVAKVSAGHAEKTLHRLAEDIFPWLGRRPLASIEAPELLTCLRRVQERGAIETAHRLRFACGQIFRYGIQTGHCSRNPAADVGEALRPRERGHHAAIVHPEGAARLLRDMAGYIGQPATRTALMLSALLLLRPGELRNMHWSWIDFDAALLTVPGEFMKRRKAEKENGPPHLVPLAPQALALLADLQPLTGHGRYVFPSGLAADRCMSENTVRAALRRMGYSNDEMTAHGFRAMARTMIAERLDIAPDVIEAQLAHSVPDTLGRAYNRTTYLDQRRKMMNAWADYIDRLRTGAEVVPLRQRQG